jgi:uncharacterized protein YndB with AHSA1/START domain
MSFQAYLDNIKAKTGLSSQDFIDAATQKGLFQKENLKPKEIIDWLKKDYQLGHGHSMAIVAVFKQKGLMDATKNKKTNSKLVKLEVSVLINGTIDHIWQTFNDPKKIKNWYHASEDWGVAKVTNNLQVGKQFIIEMRELKTMQGFDFTGQYLAIKDNKSIEYLIVGSDRKCITTFKVQKDKVKVTQLFDPETINSPELQMSGWKAILVNLKKECEK